MTRIGTLIALQATRERYSGTTTLDLQMYYALTVLIDVYLGLDPQPNLNRLLSLIGKNKKAK